MQYLSASIAQSELSADEGLDVFRSAAEKRSQSVNNDARSAEHTCVGQRVLTP